ncbi:hypothetical protein [Desulfospira joergensenii]|uniref:hypothetical protein n=1 Tax=Desulfospira joergensenii TaxID=53329 RepID=UPI0003B4D21E|nr:hypothetical protein [Desulfospira joergensenii]
MFLLNMFDFMLDGDQYTGNFMGKWYRQTKYNQLIWAHNCPDNIECQIILKRRIA